MFKKLQIYDISEIDFDKVKKEINQRIADSIKTKFPDIDLNKQPDGIGFFFPIRQNPLRSDGTEVNLPIRIRDDLGYFSSGRRFPLGLFHRHNPNRRPLTEEEKQEINKLIAKCEEIRLEFKKETE